MLRFPQRPARHRSGGFTLLEVMLVIAIMVAVLAIGWPMLQSSFRTQRLKKGGDRIRAEFSKARNLALRTGRVHVFRHAVNSNRFTITAQPSVDDEWETDEPAPATRTPTNRSADSPNSRLPDGVYFMGADVRLDQRSSIELSNLAPVTEMPDFESESAEQERTGQVNWGTPIFFFPDGTTSSAELVLANDRQRSVRITLRGLTGTSRSGAIETETEFSGGVP